MKLIQKQLTSRSSLTWATSRRKRPRETSSAISKNPVKAAKPTVISTLSIPAGTAARSNSWSHRRRERDHYGHQGPEPFGNPGSGCRSTEPEWQAQFKGKSLKNDLVVTKQDPTKDNDIRAITAATITSRAVVTGVNAARDHYMKNFANGKADRHAVRFDKRYH